MEAPAAGRRGGARGRPRAAAAARALRGDPDDCDQPRRRGREGPGRGLVGLRADRARGDGGLPRAQLGADRRGAGGGEGGGEGGQAQLQPRIRGPLAGGRKGKGQKGGGGGRPKRHGSGR